MKINKYYQNLNKRINIYSSQLDKLFKQLTKKVALIVTNEGLSMTEDFNFKDYPILDKKIQKCLNDFFKKYRSLIISSIDEEWKNSNKNHDEWLHEILQNNIKSVSLNHNKEALSYFNTRVTNGMNLSKRIWNITKETQILIESTIFLGLKEGTSAIELAQRLNESLYNPNGLLKNWKDKFGNNKKGIKNVRYNAQRLMRTEVNMAYRTAENKRYDSEDFVLGFEVKLSKNHNCKGVPEGKFFDVCDELHGKYPKSFRFVGWHPQCRCYVVPILPSTEEMAEYINKGMEDGYFNDKKIIDIPDNFKSWIKRNEDRIERAKERDTLPYFIKDNLNALE